jgi:serine-type D-Ala-D-Ala carboxypeptidase (penicillin-binding protein 5/6)
MRARLVAALAAAGLCVALSTTGVVAAPQQGSAPPIGGPLLASTGVIERPLTGAPPLPPRANLPASAWMVTNLTTGQVLAAKDPHGRFLPASTLKTLTAITLLPKLRPTSKFRATVKDATVDGSRVGLVPGTKYTIAKLFTCMLVVSANDAADALAQANGGIHHTVRQMNAEAHELQADDTVAMTPSGLDGVGETTSAYDLSLIAQAGLAMPAFRHYIDTIRSRVPAPHHKHFAIYTHNDLLTTYRGDIGVKNGYTVAAMGTYIGAATRHGQTILITLLHASPDFWPMARDLLNWGFKANRKVAPIGRLVHPLPPPATTQVSLAAPGKAGGKVVASAPTGHAAGTSWIPLEIAAAVVVVLVAITLTIRRRRSRRRRYRPRLKLPPI